MGLIYAGRMELATRYAALALVTPPDAGSAMHVGRLQDDLAVLLAEITETVTGLRLGAAFQPDIADLVRHPVRLLCGGLVALPRVDSSPDPRPPSARWADLPANPARAAGSVQVWTGLVVAAATSGQGLRAQVHHMSGAQRWTALGEIAALAEVLAVTRSDLLTQLGSGNGRGGRTRQVAAALAVEAREVVRLAGDPGEPDGRAWSPVYPGRRIVPVSTLAALPRAVENAGRRSSSDTTTRPSPSASTPTSTPRRRGERLRPWKGCWGSMRRPTELVTHPVLPMTARCASATNPVEPGTASVIPPPDGAVPTRACGRPGCRC